MPVNILNMPWILWWVTPRKVRFKPSGDELCHGRRRNASATSPICRRKHKHLCHSARRWVDYHQPNGGFVMVKLSGVEKLLRKCPACRRFMEKHTHTQILPAVSPLRWWCWEMLSFIWMIRSCSIQLGEMFFLPLPRLLESTAWMRQDVFGYTEMSEVQKEVQQSYVFERLLAFGLSSKWLKWSFVALVFDTWCKY